MLNRILIDSSKAFHRLNLDLLIAKLDAYGSGTEACKFIINIIQKHLYIHTHIWIMVPYHTLYIYLIILYYAFDVHSKILLVSQQLVVVGSE